MSIRVKVVRGTASYPKAGEVLDVEMTPRTKVLIAKGYLRRVDEPGEYVEVIEPQDEVEEVDVEEGEEGVDEEAPGEEPEDEEDEDSEGEDEDDLDEDPDEPEDPEDEDETDDDELL